MIEIVVVLSSAQRGQAFGARDLRCFWKLARWLRVASLCLTHAHITMAAESEPCCSATHSPTAVQKASILLIFRCPLMRLQPRWPCLPAVSLRRSRRLAAAAAGPASSRPSPSTSPSHSPLVSHAVTAAPAAERHAAACPAQRLPSSIAVVVCAWDARADLLKRRQSELATLCHRVFRALRCRQLLSGEARVAAIPLAERTWNTAFCCMWGGASACSVIHFQRSGFSSVRISSAARSCSVFMSGRCFSAYSPTSRSSSRRPRCFERYRSFCTVCTRARSLRSFQCRSA